MSLLTKRLIANEFHNSWLHKIYWVPLNREGCSHSLLLAPGNILSETQKGRKKLNKKNDKEMDEKVNNGDMLNVGNKV